ncbi:MAG: PKD domain-containing protein [Chitinivibrionales bacterium]|nr:PKD domain-containing protein [Chitinivibrionales bacterium]
MPDTGTREGYMKCLSIAVTAYTFCLLLVSTVASQTTCRLYFVGNSVTDAINYDGLERLALEMGNTHIDARQMIPGAPLGMLWESDGGFTTDPYGPHANALTNYPWDALSLQPFDRSLSSDTETIGYFIDEAKGQSPEIQVFIMGRWPRAPDGASLTATVWNQLWEGTYAGSYQTNETRQFFEDLYNAVRTANTDVKPALIVPVGEVFYELNGKMADGLVPGFSSIWEVYADGIHMSGVGSYIAACTYFATLYKQDPRGLSVPSEFGSIADAVRDIIQQTVYEVVFTYAYSGATLDDLIPAESVAVTPSTLAIGVLQSADVSATVLPANAANKRVSWISDNTGVAMVSSAGRVTGVSAGTAHVIAVSNDGGFRDTCVVTVSGTIGGTTETGVLAAWELAGHTDETPLAAASTMSGISSSSAMATGGGVNPASYVGDGFYCSDMTSLALNEALSSNEYISVTVTPEAGGFMSITRFTCPLRSQNGERSFALFSSVAGFTAAQVIHTETSGWNGTMDVAINGHVNISAPVEFRLYIYGVDNVYESAGIAGVNGDDVVVEGSLLTVSDNSAPTAPTELTASQVKDTSLFLSWTESTDDIVVAGYHVYRDGVLLTPDRVTATSYQVGGLSSGVTYAFTVTALDLAGNESAAASLSLMTNRAPTAVIGSDVTTGDAPLTVTFNADGSTDPDGDDFILGFEWDFGDGSAIDVSNAPSHTYAAPGTYTVTLRVMDNRDMYSAPVTMDIVVGGTVGAVPRLAQPQWPVATYEVITLNGRMLDRDVTQRRVRALGAAHGQLFLRGEERLLRLLSIRR